MSCESVLMFLRQISRTPVWLSFEVKMIDVSYYASAQPRICRVNRVCRWLTDNFHARGKTRVFPLAWNTKRRLMPRTSSDAWREACCMVSANRSHPATFLTHIKDKKNLELMRWCSIWLHNSFRHCEHSRIVVVWARALQDVAVFRLVTSSQIDLEELLNIKRFLTALVKGNEPGMFAFPFYQQGVG